MTHVNFLKTGNKYGASKQEYGGHKYHSRKEANHALELDLRVRAKDIKSWRRQVKISFDIVEGKLEARIDPISKPKQCFHLTNYYVDFEITHNDGSIELVEVKGFETDVYKLKRKLLEACLDKNIKYTVLR